MPARTSLISSSESNESAGAGRQECLLRGDVESLRAGRLTRLRREARILGVM